MLQAVLPTAFSYDATLDGGGGHGDDDADVAGISTEDAAAPEAVVVVVKAAVGVKEHPTMHTTVGLDGVGRPMMAGDVSGDSLSMLATVPATSSPALPHGGLAAKCAVAMSMAVLLLLLAVAASANHFINPISPHRICTRGEGGQMFACYCYC